jgi:acyl-CoA synthetase (NDP forming)
LKKDLSRLLSPRSIAVVGASERFGAGSNAIENLRLIGFTGRIYPVNPNYSQIHGLTCYPTLDDIPTSEDIDCVAILLGSQMIMPVLEQAAQRGIRAAWAFASGFAEVGDDGCQAQARLNELCEQNGIRFCGPNCVGFANLHARVCACSAPLPLRLRPGRISAIAQSGAVILAIANANRAIGFSQLISSGNEAVLDAVDYMEHLLDDRRTDVIVAFLESIRRPREFQQACRRAADLNKPIIVVKVGRSELARKAAVTHTGALAGTDNVQDAFFRKTGVVRVDSIDDLLETAEAFVHLKDDLPRGNRVGLITVSGGELGLIADRIEGLPLRFGALSEASSLKLRSILPTYSPVGNPLDAWGSGDLKKAYPDCIETLAGDDGLDMLLVSQDVPAGMAPKQVDQFSDVARAAVRARHLSSKPILLFSNVSGGVDPTIQSILDAGGVPCLQGTGEALAAAAALVRRAEFQERDRTSGSVPPPPTGLESLQSRLRGRDGMLPHPLAVDVLTAFGVEVAGEVLVHNRPEAHAALRSAGGAVALKVASRFIPHKTETGLLQLGITTPKELDAAWDRLQANLETHHPGVEVDGILVQQMAPVGSVEAVVGISRDEAFGPAVVVGLGGIFVEVLKDTSLELAPLGVDEARRMIARLKGAALLRGFRGRPPGDEDALADLVVKISCLAHHLRHDVSTMDLNPVMVLPRGEGLRIVDIVISAG